MNNLKSTDVFVDYSLDARVPFLRLILARNSDDTNWTSGAASWKVRYRRLDMNLLPDYDGHLASAFLFIYFIFNNNNNNIETAENCAWLWIRVKHFFFFLVFLFLFFKNLKNNTKNIGRDFKMALVLIYWCWKIASRHVFCGLCHISNGKRTESKTHM